MPHFDNQSPRSKRRKLDTPQGPDSGASITSHTQLRTLLVFSQNVAESKQGLKKFKEFLNEIGATEDEDEKAKKFRVLKGYTDSQISNYAEDPICFPDLIQTWSFADTSNNEGLLTTVPSVLALFIKSISSRLEFREFGLALCKHLLHKDQLRLFNRGLTATKSKEHLISPCLRLLTEIVSFDGGAVARLVYSSRYITFKRIEVFLTPNKAQLEENDDDSRKSTLRRNAQRYVLANLRFQHASAKADIIEQTKVIRAFLEFVRKDPRDIVRDIIAMIERDIVQDSSLSRNTRTRFFNRWNMERLVTLYGYDRESEEPNPTGISIVNEVHRLLMNVCKDSSLGVLLPETGWYPNTSDPETLPTEDDTSIELGLDSAVYVDRYRDNVPVRNGILSHVAQVLRPDTDSLQIELLVTIFKAAPELVADFFSKKVMFVSDPKPTPSWLAESALLFSTVSLPVPSNCGWKEKIPAMPPPVSVVIESILPRPLTQKTLTRCLNLNTEIITLFAVRILTIAFKKLRKVLDIFNADHGISQSFWTQAANKLLVEFSNRCPAVKDVATLYKRTAKEDLQQQEAVAELLCCFYEVVPDSAFEEGFDASLFLVDILKRLDEPKLSEDDSEMLLGQLQSILKIAQQSASMRWWQSPASIQYSAFTSILKVLAEAASRDSLKDIDALLRSVLVENSVLQAPSSFPAILTSFETSNPETLQHQIAFFDNCACRVAKKPVHYQDLLGNLHQDASKPVSPLVSAITEQWPFVVKAGNAKMESAVSAWVARVLGKLRQAGEDAKVLKAARDNLVDATQDKKVKSTLKKALKGTEEDADDAKSAPATAQPASASNQTPRVDLEEVFGALPTEGKTHNELQKWDREDLEDSIEQGRVGDLMLCLCSEYEEIRRQALANVSRFMTKLRESKYNEWRSAFLLSGELVETVKQLGLESPVPWIVGACAAHCLAVLADPMHKLYGKVNQFLQKAPTWEPEKIPSYWIDRILLHEPELDDGYFEETNWLLDLLLKGLRTEADMEIYRRANVFERILAFYESPGTGFAARRKILHIIYRATQVGGSTTLITRAGIIGWVQGQILTGPAKETPTFKAMADSLRPTSGEDRVAKWSGGSAVQVVENLVG
ncbi:NPA1/URB1 family protein [Aspergillus candidus]|uniref:Ribosome 60S biogenesis N-terminal-domain-containing protein n=1 Tax=Aspergillus candidus TaxID=41067 RepID=A0A2I2FNK9_ASPCN|nr:ribosome 60S biogenesis N-terminal-domain-containing protein [Aspergillus candidus]PLB42204.1 ribosome 60S biogenesis N-terminal-domain-containing protein [Aspergillus candidus]